MLIRNCMGGNGLRVLTVLILLWGVLSQADLETTSTLPQGVYSPKFIFGMYTGLDEKFNSAGLIEGVADQYHINLTSRTLARMNPEIKPLIDALNSVSPNERIGDDLSLGTLSFKSTPSVEYFAPTLGYGITPNLSIGVGIPIIHFRNTMQVSSQGNVMAVSRYAHGLSPAVDQATNQLVSAANNMTGSVNNILSTKGYKPIRDEDFVAPGDMQVSAVYRYLTTDRIRLAIRTYIQVPTGRPDDPDDLADIATGGQPAVGLYSIHELQLLRKFALVSSIGYQFNIQDNVSVRVPVDSDDFLPSADRKETVQRRTGNTLSLEGGVSWTPYRPMEIRLLYDFSQKDSDWFQGDRGWDYGLLSQDTANQIHQFKGLIEFSSVDMYLRKTFSVPFIFGYVYGSTLYAVNAPNQVSNQLYLRMFF